ncbi:hypothetical protein [Nonomuraea sp. NPDC046570]|uniref:hypothetical protein n=1 Tax=Nonomuraea sp. NPDC046570 TaxID=3155255 RepID=UPI0033D2C7DD
MYPLLTAYLTAFRNLPTLLVPWLLATVPLVLAALLTLPIVASESISIVNGRLTLIGPLGTPLLTWAAVLLALWLVAMTLASAAAVTLAAGYLTSSPVSLG